MHRDSEGYFHKIKCVLYMPGKYGTESICWSAAVCTSLCQSISQLVSQLVSSYFYSPTLHQSFSPSVLQFLLSMSHPQWFLSVCPSTHKTFIKQINPSYIHGHSLVIGSVSWLTVLSDSPVWIKFLLFRNTRWLLRNSLIWLKRSLTRCEWALYM